MRALRTPGTNTDVLPAWLIDQGTSHSRVEWKRGEVVKGNRGPQGPTKGSGKGEGKKDKGKKGKKSKDSAPAGATSPVA